MKTTINDVVLTPKVCSTLSYIQGDGAQTLCEAIDAAIGLVLDIRLGKPVTAEYIISNISDLRIVASRISDLNPDNGTKGGEE